MKAGKIRQKGKPKAPKLELDIDGGQKVELHPSVDGYGGFIQVPAGEWRKVYYLELEGAILAVSERPFARERLAAHQAELARREAAKLAAKEALATATGVGSNPDAQAAAPRRVARSKLGAPEPARTRRTGQLKAFFNNPYNFIPFAPPKVDLGKAGGEGLGHHAPAGHDRYREDLWHGRIHCQLEVDSPLVIVASQVETSAGNEDHKQVDVAERNGRPWIPVSSLKGCLRAAFEAVTNSRFPRFDKHSERLGFRQETKEGLTLVPCRIESEGKGHRVRLLTGFSRHSSRGPDGDGLYAAWLRRYDAGKAGTSRSAITDAAAPHTEHRHREYVHAWVSREVHPKPHFIYYKVTRAARDPATLGAPPGPGQRRIEGWVYVTNQGIKNKHDERIFFDGGKTPSWIELAPSEWDRLQAQWQELARQYRDLHSDDLRKREVKHGKGPAEYLGDKPGQTAFNPMVFDLAWEDLSHGSLAYARLDDTGRKIKSLHPVTIGRILYEHSPDELLPEEFRPAAREEEFSPADRVFGWVGQGQENRSEKEIDAYRGHLRFGPVLCDQDSKTAFQPLEVGDQGLGLPLAILGAPKPQQGRFYVGRSDGSAPSDGLGKSDAGYTSKRVLRGRKVYPRQRTPEGHWSKPTEDRTQSPSPGTGWSQEYRRPRNGGGEIRDSQNRSLRRWVKPKTTFTFSVEVENLNEPELGALLHILASENPNHRLRLGGGKPLGFGSVVCRTVGVELRSGAAVGARYQSLLAPSNEGITVTEVAGLERFRRAFALETERLYGSNPPHLRAYAVAAAGVQNDYPVHYPRVTSTPSPEGESFKWFVANDRDADLARHALPDLASSEPLPLLSDSRPDSGGDGARGSGGPSRGADKSTGAPRNAPRR